MLCYLDHPNTLHFVCFKKYDHGGLKDKQKEKKKKKIYINFTDFCVDIFFIDGPNKSALNSSGF